MLNKVFVYVMLLSTYVCLHDVVVGEGHEIAGRLKIKGRHLCVTFVCDVS